MSANTIPPDPTEEELLAAVHQLVDPVVRAARAEHGTVPGVRTAAWWTAPPAVQLAALLPLAEAWLAYDPERAVAERLRRLSWDLSEGHNWAAEAQRPSHDELLRRRAEPGPLAHLSKFDAEAAHRWVEDGRSAPGAEAAA